MPRDTAPFTFADACEIVAGARPVYWSQAAQGLIRYDFDHEGWNHCATLPGPLAETITVHGKTYPVAGPSDEQIVATYAGGQDFQPYFRAYLASGGQRGQSWKYMAWIGAKWRAWEASQGRQPDSPKSDEDRTAFLAWLNAGVVQQIAEVA